MARTAEEIAEAVRELKVTVERLAELPRSGFAGGLPEEKAVRLAQEGVREMRKELGRERQGLEEERKQPRPKVPLLSKGRDPTLAERFEEELHGSPRVGSHSA